MKLEELKVKLRSYKKEDIIITKHADLQAYVREVNLDEVKNNIVNPVKLVYFEEQKGKSKNVEKYDCYFALSDNFYHRYILLLNGKVIIATIISVNRRWQRLVEKGK